MNTLNYPVNIVKYFRWLDMQKWNSWAGGCANIKFWKIVPNSVQKAGIFKKLLGLQS